MAEYADYEDYRQFGRFRAKVVVYTTLPDGKLKRIETAEEGRDFINARLKATDDPSEMVDLAALADFFRAPRLK